MRKLLVALLVAAPLFAAELTGRVTTPDGKPIPDAHVYVYTALPKKGVSIVCPSCYRDCGKEVAVDAKGNYRIKSVDASLKFQLLAVADGYEPALSGYKEELRGIDFQLTPRDASDEARLVRGKVVDPKGQPLVGAMVTMHAVRMGKRVGYGRIPGVEPLSITNRQGEFALRVPDADTLLDVRVNARNYGVKIARELYPGVPPQTISVDVGSTVSGRLVHGDKPLPGVRIAFVQTDRRSENFLGMEEIGTDAKGNFVMTGLGTDVEYRVLPKMESIRPLTAEPKVLKTGGDGSKADAGTLVAARGFRVAGKVEGTLPADTRVSLLTDVDSQSVLVEADGRFAFEGVPAGKVRVRVSARGYEPKPVALEVKQDVGDVVLPLR